MTFEVYACTPGVRGNGQAFAEAGGRCVPSGFLVFGTSLHGSEPQGWSIGRGGFLSFLPDI